jgi:cation diffusion facilitator family transporter
MFFVNTLSAILKATSTTWTNSASVFVDMLNDLGDAVGLGLILMGLRLSSRSSSITYPYGTRRALYVLGLIAISIFSGVIFTSAIYKVIEALSGEYLVYSERAARILFTLAFIINSVSLILLYRALRGNSNNPALEGTLLDAVSDFSASTLALLALFTESTILDVTGGVVISLVILISALSIGYKYYQVLVGRSPPRSIMKSVLERVLSIPEVRDVNVFNAMMITEDEYMLILEVEVDKSLDVIDTEELSARIENIVRAVEPKFKHIVVEFVAEKREPKTYKFIMRELESTHEKRV